MPGPGCFIFFSRRQIFQRSSQINCDTLEKKLYEIAGGKIHQKDPPFTFQKQFGGFEYKTEDYSSDFHMSNVRKLHMTYMDF